MSDVQEATIIPMADQEPCTAQQIRAKVNLIQEVMRGVMKDKTHYGIVPGCAKPSLWKPGAEKLLSTFRITAKIKSVEDLSSHGVVRYRVTVTGVSPSGIELGDGIGEASSEQTKYAWREMVCKEEYEETPEDRRRTIWKKGNPNPYKVYQIKTNPADQANTILKMAHKSGLIAMCLVVTGASDIFTQDIEDMPPEIQPQASASATPPVHPPQRKSAPPASGNGATATTTAAPSATPPAQAPSNGKRLISEAQGKRFYAIAKGSGLSDDAWKGYLKQRHGLNSSRDITTDIYDEVVAWAQRGGVEEPLGEEPGSNG